MGRPAVGCCPQGSRHQHDRRRRLFDLGPIRWKATLCNAQEAVMTVTRQSSVEHFQLLSDEELLTQFRSGELTDLAAEVAGIRAAGAEDRLLHDRRRRPPGRPAGAGRCHGRHRGYGLGRAVLHRSGGLHAAGVVELEGVPAVVTDTQVAQNLVPIAIGGVRVLVPEAYLTHAREIVSAIEKGDFALDEASDEKRP